MRGQTPHKPAPVKRGEERGEEVARSRSFEWLARAGFVPCGEPKRLKSTPRGASHVLLCYTAVAASCLPRRGRG